MQSSMFIGLDVHKATISVAVAQGERGGEVQPLGDNSTPPGPHSEAGGETGRGWASSVFLL
jgi:hypothetical protein